MMKNLMQLTENLNAIVVVGSLFAFVWPVLWFFTALALGFAAGVLYYVRRSVLACIVADSTLTAILVTYLIDRSL
jgi:hypothetical protein